MKERCLLTPSHWVHSVRGEYEPTSTYLISWTNNCDRRYVTFDELEENGTREMSYAYDNALNRYSPADKAKIRQNDRRYQGSGGDSGNDRGDKRQRRGYYR